MLFRIERISRLISRVREAFAHSRRYGGKYVQRNIIFAVLVIGRATWTLDSNVARYNIYARTTLFHKLEAFPLLEERKRARMQGFLEEECLIVALVPSIALTITPSAPSPPPLVFVHSIVDGWLEEEE